MKPQFNTRTSLPVSGKNYTIFSLERLEKTTGGNLERLPYSIRILLESLLRRSESGEISGEEVLALCDWQAHETPRCPLPFFPGRVLLQDLTGVPVLVDLAALRTAAARRGGDPKLINSLIPVDLVIDHSIQVDFYGTMDALQQNTEIEFRRNRERYEFLRWAQGAFQNLRIVPPATGICHQVNLEYLSPVVMQRQDKDTLLAFPDTVVGTDSHTTMINSLGVLGWGVGGIEAISAMLGQPIEMFTPDVVGFRLSGSLNEGVTPTDLALTVAQVLRKRGVVEQFVEFTGPGVANLSLTDRAIIANMTPEYGATVSFFPLDARSLDYLRQTSRPPELVELVESYARAQGLFCTPGSAVPEFSEMLELDLSQVEASLAGPKRPQDRLALSQMATSFRQALTKPKAERGYTVRAEELDRHSTMTLAGQSVELKHGSIVIAAITSCTNTSNPLLMLGAGLVAKKAVEKGLLVNPAVKTSLSPGSRVVMEYITAAGLDEPLRKLGFTLTGFGCMTCIGNSGPLDAQITEAVGENNLVVAAILSGNRNFEGRIHPLTQANYLASPPLVVAYALAGTVAIDLAREPLGTGKDGQPVFLKDIWFTRKEITELVERVVKPEMFKASYASVFTGSATWNAIPVTGGDLYDWNPASSYIQEPPYFIEKAGAAQPPLKDFHGARALAVFGDSITTDHISPAGSIAASSPAGQYLNSLNVEKADFNSYGARRGNDRVMARGTFANIRIKNQMVPGTEGGVTLHLPDGGQKSIYDAAMQYKAEGVPLVILAGKEYGSGSSRDWAAKGPMLLGVKAVIAESFERIHRSNLAGMGILPLQFMEGDNLHSLELSGREIFSIEGLDSLAPGGPLTIRALGEEGQQTVFQVTARLHSQNEMDYLRSGGILNSVLEGLL